jgi:DNA-directed RNA polymerase subunit RPC12/RpoP
MQARSRRRTRPDRRSPASCPDNHVSPRDTGPKPGEVAVCGTCLRTAFERAEKASHRCRCGGRIVTMPRVEVEARRGDKG